jgi:hypothetical protein
MRARRRSTPACQIVCRPSLATARRRGGVTTARPRARPSHALRARPQQHSRHPRDRTVAEAAARAATGGRNGEWVISLVQPPHQASLWVVNMDGPNELGGRPSRDASLLGGLRLPGVYEREEKP